jgi:hypothetical protein
LTVFFAHVGEFRTPSHSASKAWINLLGDWWIIVAGVATDPKCFIMTPDEVRQRAVRDKNGAWAWWLPAKQYDANEFREAWHRIGRGDAALTEALSPSHATAQQTGISDLPAKILLNC